MLTQKIIMRSCVVALAAAFMIGCASQQKKKSEPVRKNEPAVTAVDVMPAPGSRVIFVPTGERTTSALMVEKSAPSEVTLNVPYTYTIEVTNLTSNTLEGVLVSDIVPQGLEIMGAEPAATGMNGGKAEWALGQMPPNARRTITVQAVARSLGEHVYCAEVTYNQLVCVTTRVVEPNLLITKSMPAEVLTCDDIDVTIVVRNSGSGTARNVVVTDTMPQGMMSSSGQSTMTFNVGDLAAGDSRELRYVAKVQSSGQYQNTANVTGDGNLSADASATVTARKPELSIKKTGPEMTYAGQQIEYQVTVKNEGDGVARNAEMVDMLPAGVTYVSSNPPAMAAGNSLRWSLGDMAPGAERSAVITVIADTISRIRNTAQASAYCAETVTASVETEVQGIPAILLEMVDDPDPVRVGTDVVYSIRVTNQGSAVGTNIVIKCVMEPEMAFVSATGPTSHNASGDTITFDALSSLAPKAFVDYRVTIKATGAGDVRFKVSLRSDQMKRDAEETEATNFYQ